MGNEIRKKQEQIRLKRWLMTVIEQSSQADSRSLWNRRELKAEWRRAAGSRARLA